MLLFAHTGIAVGGAWIVQQSGPFLSPPSSGSKSASGSEIPAKSLRRPFFPWLDYRLLLLGALLPDIIDKPLGLYFLPAQLGSGRVYSHTLLFLYIITLGGLLTYFLKHSSGLLVLAAGVFSHLLLDQMWQVPKTLLWPLYGAGFDRLEGEWLGGIWQALTSNPAIYVPEIIGAAFTGAFLWRIISRRSLLQFFQTGRLLAGRRVIDLVEEPLETGD
jgi:inner membrane protein